MSLISSILRKTPAYLVWANLTIGLCGAALLSMVLGASPVHAEPSSSSNNSSTLSRIRLNQDAQSARPKWVLPTSQKTPSRNFEPPAQNWLAGHRGIDFRVQLNQEVFAAGTGTVVFADQLAGKGVVVVNHGLIRTTYEPVIAIVEVGQQVQTGQVLGHVGLGVSHCANEEEVWCLHWGAIRNGKYLNPLLLVYPKVRLLPIK